MATSMNQGRRKSLMLSGPAQKRPQQSVIMTKLSTPPSGEATVEITDAFSRLEVTPKSRSRRRCLSQKKLDFSSVPEQSSKYKQSKMPNWSIEEIRCLLTFLMLHTDGTYWVGHKNSQFWDRAGNFIQTLIHSLHCRSGKLLIYAWCVCFTPLIH